MMSFYSPEIAVLHAAFALVKKQLGNKSLKDISSKKCGHSVDIICQAIKEIVNGLEEEHSVQQQIEWQEKLHDILLFKVCQSVDETQASDDGEVVLDKTEMLARILPPVGIVLYTEVVKRCGWITYCLSRLECLTVDIGRKIFKGILQNISSTSSSDSDINILFEILDFIVSRFMTSSCECTFLSPDPEEPLSTESVLTYVIETVLAVFQECDFQKYFENLTNSNSLPSVQVRKSAQEEEKILKVFLNLLCIEIFGTCSNEYRINQVKKWHNFNVRGFEIDFKDEEIVPSHTFFKENNLGKYAQNLEVKSTVDLNVTGVTNLSLNMLSTRCHSVVSKFYTENLKSLNLDETLPTMHLVKCPFHIQRTENGKLLTKTVGLQCSSQNVVVFCQNLIKEYQLEDILGKEFKSLDEIFDMETIMWRMNWRQPGYKDCLEFLLDEKNTDLLFDSRMISTLYENIDLIVNDEILTRLYDLIATRIEIEKEIMLKVMELVTSAFLKLPSEVKDKHICNVYEKYHCWPKEDRSINQGEITSTFNKLTSSQSLSEIGNVFRLLLQDPELVLENIIDRAVTSKDQITIYTEILKSVPGICKSCCHDSSDLHLLVRTLSSYIKQNHLNRKEQRNVFKLLTALCCAEDFVKESGSLLNPAVFILEAVTPYINVESLYDLSQPVNAQFALELLLELLGLAQMSGTSSSKHEQKYLDKLFGDINLPVILVCAGELAHECLSLSEEDDGVLSQKLNVRDLVWRFFDWLDDKDYLHEKFLLHSASWIERNISDLDVTIQIRLLGYCNPSHVEQVCLNVCNNVIKSKDSNLVLNLLRLAAVTLTTCDCVTNQVDQNIQRFNYHTFIVAIIQILPSVVDTSWNNCIRFMNYLIRSKKLTIPYNVHCGSMPLFNLNDCVELVTSQVLQEVTSLLQHTNTGKNKIPLMYYLNSYVKYLKEHIIKPCGRPSEEQAFVLCEVFCHIVKGIHWMEEVDSDPCNVILLDIVCSVGDMEMAREMKASVINTLQGHLVFIKSVDTVNMIRKKLEEITKNLK